MRRTINTITIIIFMVLENGNLMAQTGGDSVRNVHQALQMIAYPEPEFNEPLVPDLSQKDIEDMGFEQPNKYQEITFRMRDSLMIYGRKFDRSSNTTVVLLHGVLSNSYTYNKMAGLLRDALNAEIIAVDLRGHGQSEGVPGDISTLNQYSEDLEDLISAIKASRPSQKIILAGHSMGGGIILRYIESMPQHGIDGYLLFAPNLGNSAPTTYQNMDLENNFIKICLPRGLGLRMLNEYGIHKYDSLKIVFYNLPLQMPLRAYTYRSMEASMPKDYKRTLRKIDRPMLVLVGQKDEAFIAKEYPVVFKAYSKADCYVVKDETHNGIRHNEEAMKKVHNWLVKNYLK